MHKQYFLATLAYLAFLTFIVVLADFERAQRFFNLVGTIPFGDKLGHFVLMGIFSFLLNSALRCREVNIKGIKILLGSLIVCFIVLSEEVSQVFLESRNADLMDMLFDVLGIYLFGVLAKRILSTSPLSPR